MNVRILKVFSHDLSIEELTKAADAAAKTFPCRRFALAVADAVYGRGWEIILMDDDVIELPDRVSLGDVPC